MYIAAGWDDRDVTRTQGKGKGGEESMYSIFQILGC